MVSPSYAQPLGVWFESFMNQIDKNGICVDAIGVHHYGGPNVDLLNLNMQTIYQ